MGLKKKCRSVCERYKQWITVCVIDTRERDWERERKPKQKIDDREDDREREIEGNTKWKHKKINKENKRHTRKRNIYKCLFTHNGNNMIISRLKQCERERNNNWQNVWEREREKKSLTKIDKLFERERKKKGKDIQSLCMW